MPGPRQPLELLEAKGLKHMGKQEKAARAAGEVHVDMTKQVRAPKYLPTDLKKTFVDLGNKLKTAGLLTELDYDNLARYLLAWKSYLTATQDVLKTQEGVEEAGRRLVDLELLEAHSKIQERFFKQCRACANDMGLTVTSRCRLVLPPTKAPEENSFEKLMRERREKRNA